MKTLWLTYAWKDNQEAGIDHIIGRLRSPDMSVNLESAKPPLHRCPDSGGWR